MERENRYLVLKLKDVLSCLDVGEYEVLSRICDKVMRHRELQAKPPLQCVVVESDWPEYEPIWAAIARRMDGSATKLDTIKYGIEHQYVVTKTGRKCYVTAVDCQDGACLIVELYDEHGLDISGELLRVEASELTEVSDL